MVKIYKNGIVIQGMGLKTHRFTWGEISGISCQESKHHFWGMLLKDKIQPVLHPSTGKPVILYSRLPNLRELCARIKAKIYPRMLLKMRTAMRSGSTVYFGPIFFNNQSIHIRKKGYRWNQVTAIDVQNGILRITLKEQPDRRIPIAKIPNIELFIQLVQEGLIE
jgi:hypothetical protein